MKVTENLIEPPKFRLTRGLILPLAPTLAHLGTATTGMSVVSVRFALMVQITTNALSDPERQTPDIEPGRHLAFASDSTATVSLLM